MADIRWVNAGELAIAWGAAIGQEFGIVKVKDCRGQDYLAEVTKYVVKPAQLVSWEPEEIAQFIRAVQGVRMFATFGTLFKLARHIRALMEQSKPETKPCDCGCSDFSFADERNDTWRQITREGK